MIFYPAVIVHGLADAKAAVAPGLPVTLVSAPGAAGFAGCLWWRELLRAARASAPKTVVADVFDCADSSGMAMGAIRSGIFRLIVWPGASGRDAVAAIAEREGGFVLKQAPIALDLGQRNTIRQLHAWLVRPEDDRRSCLG
jgi:hypothetical protein